MKINENAKITLTIGQLKKLVKESEGTSSKVDQLKKTLAIVGNPKIEVRADGFIMDPLRFYIDRDTMDIRVGWTAGNRTVDHGSPAFDVLAELVKSEKTVEKVIKIIRP